MYQARSLTTVLLFMLKIFNYSEKGQAMTDVQVDEDCFAVNRHVI